MSTFAWVLTGINSSTSSGISPPSVSDVYGSQFYAGTSATRSVNMGIDMSGSGNDSMLWYAGRYNFFDVCVASADRGLITNVSRLDGTDAYGTITSTDTPSAFTSTGFDSNTAGQRINQAGQQYNAVGFKKEPGFLDIIEITGDGTTSRTINHSLGVVPKFMMFKVDSPSGWKFYFDSRGPGVEITMSTNGEQTELQYLDNTAPTDTEFTIGSTLNGSGAEVVAYLFAGDDIITTQGDYVATGIVGQNITLPFEPAFLFIKRVDATGGNPIYFEDKESMSIGADDPVIIGPVIPPAPLDYLDSTATGFTINTIDVNTSTSGGTYTYFAIAKP